MKSKIYGNKEIIYPEINSESFEKLYNKYIDYENSKKISILISIRNIIHILLSSIYYIGVFGTIFYLIFSSFNKVVETKNLFSFIEFFILLLVFCIYISFVTRNGMDFWMFDFLGDIIDKIFKVDKRDELIQCLRKNVEVSRGVDRLRNSKQEEIKCITVEDFRGVLVFKIGEKIFNIKNQFSNKPNMDENGTIDYSYLDKTYLECIEMFKKLNKKIEI